MTKALTTTQRGALRQDQAVNLKRWLLAFRMWLANHQSDNTRTAYQRAFHAFSEDVGQIPPHAITREHVLLWRVTMQERELAAETINLRLSALSSFYRFVNEHYPDLREDNPVRGVKRMSTTPYGKARAMHGDEDVRLLLSIDTGTLDGLRDFAAILLMLTAGMRVGPVAAARIGSLALRDEDVYISYTDKGSARRTKKLAEQAWQALDNYLAARHDRDGGLLENAPLFDFGGNVHVTKVRNIQFMITGRCDEVFGEGHGITPHSLRHTAAVRAEKNGARIAEISALLGHADARITMIYLSHVAAEEADNVSEKLAERYAQLPVDCK